MLFSINVYATYIVCIYSVMFDLTDEYVNTEYIEDKRINVCWFKVSRIRIYEHFKLYSNAVQNLFIMVEIILPQNSKLKRTFLSVK